MLSADDRDRKERRLAGRRANALQFLAPIGRSTWRAASGRRMRHTVYSLIGCPPVASAIYLLIRRGKDGTPRVLAVRRTRSRFPSLNLARIRRAGARLGANEVHLYETSGIDRELADIVNDLSCSAHEEARPARGVRYRR